MVESSTTAMSTGLSDAKAVDEQHDDRIRSLATAGQNDPRSLSSDDIKELCSTLLTLFDSTKG